MSEAQFWSLTFLEGHLLTQAYWQQEARRDRGIALVAQILLNVNRGEHVSPFELDQVMAMLGHQIPEPPVATPEQLHATFELLKDVLTPQRNGRG